MDGNVCGAKLTVKGRRWHCPICDVNRSGQAVWYSGTKPRSGRCQTSKRRIAVVRSPIV